MGLFYDVLHFVKDAVFHEWIFQSLMQCFWLMFSSANSYKTTGNNALQI